MKYFQIINACMCDSNFEISHTCVLCACDLKNEMCDVRADGRAGQKSVAIHSLLFIIHCTAFETNSLFSLVWYFNWKSLNLGLINAKIFTLSRIRILKKLHTGHEIFILWEGSINSIKRDFILNLTWPRFFFRDNTTHDFFFQLFHKNRSILFPLFILTA